MRLYKYHINYGKYTTHETVFKRSSCVKDSKMLKNGEMLRLILYTQTKFRCLLKTVERNHHRERSSADIKWFR